MSGAPGTEPGVDEELLDDDGDGDWPAAEPTWEGDRGGAVTVIAPRAGAFAGRLDKLLATELPQFTRGQLQRFIEEGRVRVNGGAARAKDKVRAGAHIEVVPGPGPATTALPDPSVIFGVLFEDEQLIVVDKPAGLVVHPGRGHATGTLVNGLLARPGFERPAIDPRDPNGQLRPGIVHRIDKDTSGILVVAKTEAAREALKVQFADHSIERVYQAITVGVPAEGTIDTLHGRDPGSRLRFSSRVVRGKRAVTRVRVTERLARGQAALIECRLETGRTHQIRVHLSQEARTPLLADELYGGLRGPAEVVEVGRSLGRQALHAAVLGFRHPAGHELRFERPLPDDIQEALVRLRGLDG